jgi:hypothetical protein
MGPNEAEQGGVFIGAQVLRSRPWQWRGAASRLPMLSSLMPAADLDLVVYIQTSYITDIHTSSTITFFSTRPHSTNEQLQRWVYVYTAAHPANGYVIAYVEVPEPQQTDIATARKQACRSPGRNDSSSKLFVAVSAARPGTTAARRCCSSAWTRRSARWTTWWAIS